MNFVEPIRNKEVIKIIYEDLKRKNERDSLMFLVGVYTGLRISDILNFKVKDIFEEYYNIREKKTGKQFSYEWNPNLKRAINNYILNANLKNKDPEDYLFESRNTQKGSLPITRQRAYKIIRAVCNNRRSI